MSDSSASADTHSVPHWVIAAASSQHDACQYCIQHDLQLPALDALLAHGTLKNALGGVDFWTVQQIHASHNPSASPHHYEEHEQLGGTNEEDALWQPTMPYLDLLRQSKEQIAKPWLMLTPLHLFVGLDGVFMQHPKDLTLMALESRRLMERCQTELQASNNTLEPNWHWRLEYITPLAWRLKGFGIDALAPQNLQLTDIARAVSSGASIANWQAQWIGQGAAPPWLDALLRRLAKAGMYAFKPASPLLVSNDSDSRDSSDANHRSHVPTTPHEPNALWLSWNDPFLSEEKPAHGMHLENTLQQITAHTTPDWQLWCAAWQQIDAQLPAQIHALIQKSQQQNQAEKSAPKPLQLRISLCGEKTCATFLLTKIRKYSVKNVAFKIKNCKQWLHKWRTQPSKENVGVRQILRQI